MKRIIIVALMIFGFLLSGCGSNSNVDPEQSMSQITEINTSLPIVVIDKNQRDVELTSNSQVKNIAIKVFKEGAPYTEGKIKVVLPNKILEGIDVGYFESYEVSIGGNGLANFIYVGPQDLQDLINDNDKFSTFKFYHEDNPTQYQEITMHYEPDSEYVPVSYTLTTEGNYTMGLNSEKTFTLHLKDDKDQYVNDADIKNIKINALNSAVGQLDNSGTLVNQLEYSNDDATNNKSFVLVTNTTSGLLPIEIVVNFVDKNGNAQELSTVMNLTVFSGPPTAFSISYVGVELDDTNAKYIEKFAVSATDAYNNPVNTKPYIATGALVEYAVDGSSADGKRTTTSPRLWHGANDSKGKIEQLGDNTAQFIASTDAFKYVDIDNDRLVVFGRGYVYEALGKWDWNGVDDATIQLKDNYAGQTRDGLYFAVGHNNRQDMCSDDGKEYIGTMKSSTYQLDANGNVLLEFAYDYHLTGKDIMVWVNMTGYQADNDSVTRVGEAQKHTLRGMGLNTPDKYTVKAETDNNILHFNIHHEKVAEWYKNGHFGFSIEGECTVDSVIAGSNLVDARSCDNAGVAYIDLNVSNGNTDDCTITLKDIVVSSEF